MEDYVLMFEMQSEYLEVEWLMSGIYFKILHTKIDEANTAKY